MDWIKPYRQTGQEKQRTSSWRRRPIHAWRGRRIDTLALKRELAEHATARLRRHDAPMPATPTEEATAVDDAANDGGERLAGDAA